VSRTFIRYKLTCQPLRSELARILLPLLKARLPWQKRFALIFLSRIGFDFFLQPGVKEKSQTQSRENGILGWREYDTW